MATTLFETSVPLEPINVIRGSSSNDSLIGTSNDDILTGLAGDDILFGLQGNDYLVGDNGVGGNGNDILNGGKGSDILQGDGGNNLLVGGAGNDKFFIGLEMGINTILDFTKNQDILDLSGLRFNEILISPVTNGTLITRASNGEILATLVGVAPSLIGPENFVNPYKLG
jgi:Ca2+-binding RTX toxin-like protein